MKIRHVVWVMLLASLFAQPTLAEDAVKAKVAEMKLDAMPKAELPSALNPTLTRYEITIDPKIVKDDEALIKLRARLESAEVFRSSECVRDDPCGRADRKKNKISLRYSCNNVSCKTDDLFRGPAFYPGVQMMSATISLTCPTGCRTSANCTGGLYYTCCKSPGTGQYCPGYAP